MNNFLKKSSILLLFILSSFAIKAQASLTIKNNSGRSMTLKVMKGSYSNNSIYETVYIAAYSEKTVNFYESGNYFTKTKAVLKGKDPVYQKGQVFYVTNDDSGYSVLTITFSITESSVPQLSGGKQISKTEFDKN
jgi:hypothetical protein